MIRQTSGRQPRVEQALDNGVSSTPTGRAQDTRRMLKVRIPPDLSRVQDARRLMERVASLAPLDDRRLFDLKVVVSEACANAIEHAGKEVEVTAWILPDRIVVEISSEGEFQARLLSDESLHGRGLGLPLMAALADQVQVTRLSNATTRVSLTFLLETEPSASGLLEDPRVHGLVLTPEEVREREHLEQQLTKRAFYDPLTRLANRALLFDRGKEALSRTGRSDGSVAILLLDIDDFKAVNDSLGHAAGDRLLTTVAARLKGLLRTQDTAARLGGDEFVLLLENDGEPLDVGKIADRVLTRLSEPYDLSPGGLSATFSVGVATSRASVKTFMGLLQQADIALYAAKSQGKNRWKQFEPAMLDAERAKRQSEEELRRALESEEIVAYFQPILSADEGSIVGLEALVRWNHPSRDLLLPESFLELAEDTGLIVPLGYEVLGQACRCLRDWDARDPDRRLRLMANLSPGELRKPDLPDRIVAALKTGRIAPKRLVLEITEDALTEDSVAIAQNIAALRAAGVRMALDDFGTGQSSLRDLKDYPIDILKMAPHLVQAVNEADGGALLATAVMSLARSAGLQVVAEGIERREQMEHLRSLGCDMWQGNYFSPAVPWLEVPALLERRLD